MAHATLLTLNLSLTETIHYLNRQLVVTDEMLTEVVFAGYPRTLDGARIFATDGINNLMDSTSHPHWAAAVEAARDDDIESTEVRYEIPGRTPQAVLGVTTETLRQAAKERLDRGKLTPAQAQAILDRSDHELKGALSESVTFDICEAEQVWYDQAIKTLI